MSSEHKNVAVMDSKHHHYTLRFNNEDSAAHAVSLLRRTPGIVFAMRVKAYPAPCDTVLGESNEAFVSQMLAFL